MTSHPAGTPSRDISNELGMTSQAAGSQMRYAALQAVIDRTVQLELADLVSVTEVRADGLLTRVATDDDALRTDGRQYDLDEGPSVEATGDLEEAVICSGDTAQDARWPTWGPWAATQGCAAVISVQLFTIGHQALGAVNLIHRAPRRYTTADVDAAGLVATHASLALAAGRHDEHLWLAVDGRHLIGMAQGVVMNRFALDEQESFAFLRRLSQASNIKLHVIAEQIVRTRSIPGIDGGHDDGGR